MTKIYNTCVLPAGDRVEEILDLIQPPISERQREVARAMICEYNRFIKSSTFSLNDQGKIWLNSCWFTGDLHLDELVVSIADQLQFEQVAGANVAGGATLQRITDLYRESVRATWFQDRIDADQMVDAFCEDRIRDQWPAARQSEIEAGMFFELSRVTSGEISASEMFQQFPDEPTDSFRARYAGW